VFPLQGDLYGRSIGAAKPHRFLPGSKGGLYAWQTIRHYPEIILVDGLFDLAVLWQAGQLVGHFFDGSRLNQLAALRAMAKVTGRLVCLEPGAHDVAEGAMRGQTMPRVKAELLVNPYSAGIRIRILRLHGDPCNG
jgi:hypothetical protein